MKIFVDKKAEVVVELFTYTDEKGKDYIWTSNIKENVPANLDSITAGINKNRIIFRLGSYKDTLDLLDSSMRMDSAGSFTVSASSLTFYKFTKFLKSWDFKDDAGNFIPVSNEMVANFQNGIAQLILRDYDMQAG